MRTQKSNLDRIYNKLIYIWIDILIYRRFHTNVQVQLGWASNSERYMGDQRKLDTAYFLFLRKKKSHIKV